MERRPTFSVVHTSARPEKWKAVYDEWMAKADHPEDVEYCLCIDKRWGFDARMARDAQELGIVVSENTGRMCYVDGVNIAAAASSGRILVPNADDLFPLVHWDTLILGALCGPAGRCNVCGWPMVSDRAWSCSPGNCGMRPRPLNHVYEGTEALDSEAIVIGSSGAPPERDLELMTAFAMTRARYERYGYIVDPDFEGMWSDNHFAWQARRDEKAGLVKVVERLDIQMDHPHPIFGKGEIDAAYKAENKAAAYQQGQATFLKKAYGTQALYVC